MEELKEMMRDNEYLQEAAQSLYVANADEIVRQQCRARADAERRERTLERDIKLLKVTLQEKEQTIIEKDRIIAELQKKLSSR